LEQEVTMKLVTLVLASLLGVSAAQEVVYRPGDGVSLPRVTKEVKAQYTPEAMQARIEGTVLVDAVVRADGTVGDVAVIRSLDTMHGLDDEAVRATKQWEFESGRKDGKAVAVRVTIEHTFRLK
jgi:protein TonB